VGGGAPLAAEVLAKIAVYAAVLFAVGIAGAQWLTRLALQQPSAAPLRTTVERDLRRRARWTAACLLLAIALRAVAHTVAAFGTVDAHGLWVITIESRWGQGWRPQLAAAALLGIAALWLRDDRQPRWMLYAAACLLCCASIPLLGHAGGSDARLTVHALHVAGAGLWVGTLACMASLWSRLSAFDPSAPRLVVARFASLALPSSAVLVLTGVIASTLYLQTLPHLWNTAYGRTLAVKLSFVAAVAACGWLNWRRSRRGSSPHGGIIALELAGACMVVIVTAVLTELEHP
jgi:putative copper export protein